MVKGWKKLNLKLVTTGVKAGAVVPDPSKRGGAYME